MRLILAIVLAAIFVSACGEETRVDPAVRVRPATLEELTGPWQPTPLVLDPVMRERVAATCRRDMERQPGSLPGVIDVRGGGVAVVRMIGQSAGECSAIQITNTGEVVGAGGGSTASGLEQLPALGDAELAQTQIQTVEGGDLTVRGWSVIGRAGASIASVTIEPQGGGTVVASLDNGWFAAWWPAELPDPGRGRLPDFPQMVVRGYDASGAIVAEIVP